MVAVLISSTHKYRSSAILVPVCCTNNNNKTEYKVSVKLRNNNNKTEYKVSVKLRAVLMGTKSCTKILNFSTRFSCENLAVEDFVTLLMGKKSC